METNQDVVFGGKNRQGQRPGIHQNPGLPPACQRTCGCPQDGGDQQRAQPSPHPENLHDLPMTHVPSPSPPAARRPLPGLLHLLVLLLACCAVPAWGATFLLPADGSDVVGQLQVVTADSRNTLLDIARHYDLGYEEITVANPGVSTWLPGEGTRIV